MARTPKIPQTPCTEIAPTGSSIPLRSKKNTDSTTMHRGDRADDRGRPRLHEGTRGGDRHQAGEHAVDHHAGVGLAHALHAVEHRDRRAERRRDGGVDRDHGEAQVGGREGRGGVEPEPPEQQDERPEHGHRDVVRRQRARLPVGPELADAGAEHDRAGEAGDATHRVHHTRTGEVDVAEAEVPAVAELRQPAAAPGPPTEDRVVEGAAEEAPAHERLPLPPLGHGTGRDGRGRVHEGDHVEEERRHRDAVRDPGEARTRSCPRGTPSSRCCRSGSATGCSGARSCRTARS